MIVVIDYSIGNLSAVANMFKRLGVPCEITSDIENYLGFPEGINGFELTEKFKNQAEKFCVKSLSDTVVKVNLSIQP